MAGCFGISKSPAERPGDAAAETVDSPSDNGRCCSPDAGSQLEGGVDAGMDAVLDAGSGADLAAEKAIDAGLDTGTKTDVAVKADASLGDVSLGGIDAAVDVGIKIDADAGIETTSSGCAQCSTYGTPQTLGTIPPELPELSGLASSQVHPGILYTHNDSGDTARFFAMNESAVVTAEMHLTGPTGTEPTATDWEDISVGACPAGWCVYIGDTGDNKLVRDQYIIYRVTEPPVLPTDGSIITVAYDQFPFVYPDGPHNTETLLIHPITGQIFVITKDKDVPATVFEMPMPLTPNQQVTMIPVATLVLDPNNGDGIATDGSFHPCGDRMLLRTTKFLFEFRRNPGDSLVALFTSTPVMVPVADEQQGEAVTFALDGLHYFTSSETKSGNAMASLSEVGCATQ